MPVIASFVDIDHHDWGQQKGTRGFRDGQEETAGITRFEAHDQIVVLFRICNLEPYSCYRPDRFDRGTP